MANRARDGQPKTSVLHVRVTPEHQSKLDRLAARSGMPAAWIVRNLIEKSELVHGAVFVGAAMVPAQPESEG